MPERPEFDPSDPQYKKVTDLPAKEQAGFAAVDGGFIRREAADAEIERNDTAIVLNARQSWLDRWLEKPLLTTADLAYEEAQIMELKLDLDRQQELMESLYEDFVLAAEDRLDQVKKNHEQLLSEGEEKYRAKHPEDMDEWDAIVRESLDEIHKYEDILSEQVASQQRILAQRKDRAA